MAPALAADHVMASAAVPDDAPTRRLPRQSAGPAIAPNGRRGRAVNLDSLAIGAPLTAAFVGALLAESGLAASSGQDPGAQTGAVGGAGGLQPGEAGPGATGHSGLPQAPASESATAGGAAAQQAALDPVAAGASPAAAALPPAESGGGGRADGAASEVSAAVGGKAATAGAAGGSITLLSLDAGAPDGTAGPGDDDDGAGRARSAITSPAATATT